MAPVEAHPAVTFVALADELRERAAGEPAGPAVRTVGVDGYSGAGKTWFASRLAAELGAPTVATDDFVPGWSGLAESVERLAEWILLPARRGDPLRYRRYDWHTRAAVGWVDLPASALLVVEGCGVLAPPAGDLLWCSVWIDAPLDDRRARLVERDDWADYEPFAETWARQETMLHRRWRTKARAALVVDNSQEAAAAAGPDAFVLEHSELRVR